MTSIDVTDSRKSDDSSLALVPYCYTYADLQEHFGVEVDRSMGWDAAPAGASVFNLTGFTVRTAPSFLCKVVKNGQPFEGVLMCAYYPRFEATPTWAPIPRYHSLVFGDFTNSEGVWGLPIGGLLIDVDNGTGGPVDLWPNADPDLYADAAKRIGWYPATDHLACHPEWEYVVKEGGSPPPSGAAYLGIFHNGVLLYHLPLVPGMPPSTDEFNGLGYIDTGGRWIWHARGIIGQP